METNVLGISQIRDRQFVLSCLVPKMVGIAFDRGHDVYGYGGCSVHVTPDLLVSVSRQSTVAASVEHILAV